MSRTARYYLPPVVWMGVIFIFSTALFSGRGTGSILETILSFVGPDIEADTVEAINYLVRKAAHFTVYAILAILWTRALVLGRGMALRRAVLAAFAIAALYSVTDEFHQSFVPERDASPYDVVLDSLGAGAGAFLAWRYGSGGTFNAHPAPRDTI